jgi:hypothetical protein
VGGPELTHDFLPLQLSVGSLGLALLPLLRKTCTQLWEKLPSTYLFPIIIYVQTARREKCKLIPVVDQIVKPADAVGTLQERSSVVNVDDHVAMKIDTRGG